MARFVELEDFSKNDLCIASNQFDDVKLQFVIDKVEPEVLKELLGFTLYDAFIADYDEAPENEFSEPRFKTIFDPLNYEEVGGCQITSEGIKRMLMYLIYFEYLRNQPFRNTSTGMTRNLNENSIDLKPLDYGLTIKYNEGIKTYNAIQFYICKNPESYDYDDYNGKRKELASWL